MPDETRCPSCGHVVEYEQAVSRIPVSNAGFCPVTDLSVVEWEDTPEPCGRPVAVVVLFTMPGGGEAGMRLKSAAACDALVEAIERHRNNVWPHAPKRGRL